MKINKDGFTLIELLVVILIIGILIAVAAPSFLGQQKKAQDSAAKQSLSVAYKAAKAAAVDNGGAYLTLPSVMAVELENSEPQLAFAAGTTYSPAYISVNVAAGVLELRTQSGSGANFTLTDNPASGPVFP